MGRIVYFARSVLAITLLLCIAVPVTVYWLNPEYSFSYAFLSPRLLLAELALLATISLVLLISWRVSELDLFRRFFEVRWRGLYEDVETIGPIESLGRGAIIGVIIFCCLGVVGMAIGGPLIGWLHPARSQSTKPGPVVPSADPGDAAPAAKPGGPNAPAAAQSSKMPAGSTAAVLPRVDTGAVVDDAMKMMVNAASVSRIADALVVQSAERLDAQDSERIEQLLIRIQADLAEIKACLAERAAGRPPGAVARRNAQARGR